MSKEELTPTDEQRKVLENTFDNVIVSASAGSGKTWVLVEYITKLVCEKAVPLKKLLVLTFTNNASQEMKERLLKSIMKKPQTKFLIEQLDDLPTADICTIDAFCQKVVKRNLDKLSLDESFQVLDEGAAKKLKADAFEKACEIMSQTDNQDYLYFYTCFKKNKFASFDCITAIEDFLDCAFNADEIIEKILSSQSQIFDECCEFLAREYKNQLEKIINKLSSLSLAGERENYVTFAKNLIEIAKSLSSSASLQELYDKAKVTNLPSIPKASKAADKSKEVALLGKVKEDVQDILDKVCGYNFDNGTILQAERTGKLARATIKLYKIYKECYNSLKSQGDKLDFVDIEKLCSGLLEDPQVAASIQDDYDYVFVDEYQDTNRLQERLIKLVGKNAKFVAVGDPKQAIYGFRNAVLDIMKEDISAFESQPNNGALYLKGNFRSDKQILDFVNSLFTPIMRKDNVGIDYSLTSKLEFEAKYKPSKENNVEISLIDVEEDKSNIKDRVYSVKDDIVTKKDSCGVEVMTILTHIDDLLTQKIYDLKLETWREVQLSDICVLMRGRGKLMDRLVEELTKRGYAFTADNKLDVTDESEVQVLLSLLKYCLNKEEIPYISLLLSQFGGMSINEISSLVLGKPKDMPLLDYLFSLNNEKIEKLNDNIAQFKVESELYGIRRAFELLFDRCDYFPYLEYLGSEKTQAVERFLASISSSGFDNSLSSLLGFFGALSSGKSSSGSADKNAINIMTIHGSKGMEFPIVILADCGKNICPSSRTSYEICSQFGLATFEYDIDNLIKSHTPQIDAVRILNHRREYIDELMIFYTALTRAKNKLILTGQYNREQADRFSKTLAPDFMEGKSYFDWLFMTIENGFKDSLFFSGKAQNSLAKFKVVTDVKELGEIEKQNIVTGGDDKLEEKISKYIDFCYPNLKLSKIEFKNSVTGLLKLSLEEGETQETPRTYAKPQGKYSASEIGIIYHEILKDLDFDKVTDSDSLQKELSSFVEQGYILQEELDAVEQKYILQDVLLLKNLLADKKIFKEKEFIMKLPLCEVFDTDIQDNILVQGVVDLFALGEENILVDYKFSSIEDEKILLSKYSKQLSLYCKAIEKAFKIKIHKKYLLSLKNAKLIEFFE